MKTCKEMKKNNQLQVIVKNSGLEKTKAQYILEKFTNYFEIASEWEKKAKEIVVTKEDDEVEMQMARVGRLFLRDKRIAIEKARVELKQQALREGKAIDGISNVLKGLIIPIEEYLEKQEKFVELKEKAEAEKERIEEEEKAERERIAKEEAERKEQERIRLENVRLQKEAMAREKKMKAEREKAQAKLKAEREASEKAQAKLKAEREASEKAQAEIVAKAKAERVEAEILAKQEREEVERLARIEREKAEKMLAKERAAAEKVRLEKEKVQRLLDEQIECPFCHRKFNK